MRGVPGVECGARLRLRPLLVMVLVGGLTLGSCAEQHEPTKRGDGAELLYRPAGSASAQNPAFSPDGKSLLFTLFHGGYNKGPAGLHVLPLDRAARDWTLVDEQDRAAVNLPGSSWSSSGAITFAFDRDGNDEIWTVAPGAHPIQVTKHGGRSGYIEPSFSPAANWIVFEESGGLSSIWKVGSDGTGLTRLLDGPTTGTDNRQPNWSPRGDRIVFQRRVRNSDEWALFTMTSDGSDLRRLTSQPGDHTDPSWSPDGRWVVFSSNQDGLDLPQIFVVSADGGQAVRITKSRVYDGAPSWSPDGRWIAFESHPGAEDHSTSLWRIKAPQQR